MFAGIGGLRKGFTGFALPCSSSIEWDKFAVKTYDANHHAWPGHKRIGDITKVDAHDVPDHDILLAGFPCQAFSTGGLATKAFLGQASGFACTTKGTLFFDVCRVLDAKRPAFFVLENVRNITSHDKGRTFAIMKAALVELNYIVSHATVDAAAWLPQHRERVYILGIRADVHAQLPPYHQQGIDKWQISHQTPMVLGDILHHRGRFHSNDVCYTDGFGEPLAKYTLSNNTWSWLQAHAAKHKASGNGFGFSVVKPHEQTRTLSARYHKDGSEILVDQGPNKNPRKLTPRECSRLMGFDSAQGSDFIIPVSDTQAYTQFGNAVCPPVARWIAYGIAGAVISITGMFGNNWLFRV